MLRRTPIRPDGVRSCALRFAQGARPDPAQARRTCDARRLLNSRAFLARCNFCPMPAEALALQDRLLKAMSPERKLLASEALRNAAWELKAAWISSRHPDLTALAVQQRVRQIFLDVGS